MKINIIQNVSTTLEVASVLFGLKKCAIVNIHRDFKKSIEKVALDSGLSLVFSGHNYTINKDGFNSTSFVSDVGDYNEAYISREIRDALFLKNCVDKNDSRSVGVLLGYPNCCINSHLSLFALGQLNEMDFLPFVDFNHRTYDWRMNIFAQKYDASLLSHYPCSLECEQSLVLAKRREACLHKHVSTSESYDICLMSRGRVVFVSETKYYYTPFHIRSRENMYEMESNFEGIRQMVFE